VAAAGFTAAAAGSWCGADPSEAACTRKLRERREKREKLSEKKNGEEREKVEDKREESKGNNAAQTGKVKEGEKEEGVGSILISEGAKGGPSAHLQRPGKTIRIPKSRRKVKFLCWSFQNYSQYSTCAPSPSSLASSASTITQPSDSGFGQLAIAVSKAARSTSLGNAAESE
jgi:hypothetical protein